MPKEEQIPLVQIVNDSTIFQFDDLHGTTKEDICAVTLLGHVRCHTTINYNVIMFIRKVSESRQVIIE